MSTKPMQSISVAIYDSVNTVSRLNPGEETWSWLWPSGGQPICVTATMARDEVSLPTAEGGYKSPGDVVRVTRTEDAWIVEDPRAGR